ncbi:protein rolling stone-like [Drosophila tropicalis]|uniref:protein rolling stone-like n=1 Tax=Drosophila tropicalis TaxID=46794 RepID=UPI0035AC008F
MRDPNEESCCQPFKEEFQRSKFSLHHDEPGVFCRSQWQRGDRSLIWLLYRWFLAAFFGTGVIMSLSNSFDNGRWFVFLTDWGFTLCFYACAYGAIVATIYFIKPSYFAPGSWSLKIYWISHYTTTVLAFLITLVFWSALYPSMPGMADDIYNIWAHATNTAFMLLDCFIVAFPTRLMHFIYPFIVGLTYGLFSLIYYLAGVKQPIYFILDWSDPGLAIGTICVCIVLVSCFCILVFWIYIFRRWLHGRCVKPEVTVTMETRAPAPEIVQRV